MDRLSRLALNDEGFAFDPMTGDSFLVNRTGLEIIRGLIQSRDDAAIIRTLTDDYAVAAEDAERDLADFRARLNALGLL